ncbi:Uncharacterised protein [Escherichia coli]|nr:Uncharacterised protein [Escherichia coli]CSQ78733.1 Uncharacterised protein [Shigella sonnei]
MPESARYLSNLPRLRFAAAATGTPDTAADGPVIRGCLTASRAARTAPAGPPSPGRGHGIHREHVQIATVTWRGHGRTVRCTGPGHRADPSPLNRAGKCPAHGHLLSTDFSTQQSPQTSLVDAAIRQHPDIQGDAIQSRVRSWMRLRFAGHIDGIDTTAVEQIEFGI